MEKAEGVSFGTFGELLQGSLPGESSEFLVTFPIDLYSRALFSVGPGDDTLSVQPREKQKALRLARRMLEHYQLPCRGRLELISQIPEGKGLASSSADLVATARALATCFGIPISYRELEAFLRAIEPTDGVMYPGVVSFFHQRVELGEHIGFLPRLTVLAIDEGGTVDTVEFNCKPKNYTDQEKAEYQSLLERIKDCIQRGDLQGLGQVTTRSAVLNQRINPKRSLELMLEVSLATGAFGVVTAHSGTCIGLLLSPEDAAYRAKLEEATARLEVLSYPVETYHAWSWRQGGGGLKGTGLDNPLWMGRV
ncbi:hypothetical protein [Archangium sp.]|uniref:GHMP family kinase ATP-binding protein n=1 Tax=Archangium sp. TaxID=1872627 RepID=UPI00286B9DBE|nr:hypothetical protein [Archangium sp.]